MVGITDEMIEKDMLDQAKVISKRIDYILSNIGINDIDIPNIGITYNNKLLEIIQVFRSREVALSDNLLLVIINYLINIANEASLLLINYKQTFLKENLTSFLRNAMIRQRENLAEKYREFDKRLFSFTLEKDILEAIKYDIRIGQENCVQETQVKSYKESLVRLGVSRETLESISDFETGYCSI